MDATTYSDARANLKTILDRAVDDHVQTIITRRGGRSCVVVSLEDWNAMHETNYVRSTRANRQALERSMAQAEAGEFVSYEPEADER